MSILLANADALRIPLADKSVHMIATSTPYWGLRDYGLGDNGLGLESLHDCLGWARGENCGACFVCRIRLFAAEGRRVLRDDGTFWLNLGDSYAGSGKGGNPKDSEWSGFMGNGDREKSAMINHSSGKAPAGLKPKDLVGIPWRVALALQADGWWLRSDIIWAKSNPMPESVKDRPTKAHEYIFLLAKRERYFYDQDAVREEAENSSGWARQRKNGNGHQHIKPGEIYLSGERNAHTGLNEAGNTSARNRRTVWNIATTPYPGAHFACWPPALVEPMIKAGTSERGCCPECGAQWQRVVKKGAAEMRPDNPNPVIPYTANGSTQHGLNSSTLHMTRERQTVDWRPTCSHDAAPVPCTVLDPCSGSGTTGQVARQLGRHFIGLDLSFDYLSEQAKSRLDLDLLESWGSGITDTADYSRLFEPVKEEAPIEP